MVGWLILVFMLGFLLGFGAEFFEFKGKVKRGLMPFIGDDGEMVWHWRKHETD